MANGRKLLYSMIYDNTEEVNAKSKLKLANDIVDNIQTNLHVYHLENLKNDRSLIIIEVNRASETLFKDKKGAERILLVDDEELIVMMLFIKS